MVLLTITIFVCGQGRKTVLGPAVLPTMCTHRNCSLVWEECTVCKVNDCLLLNLDSQLQGVFPPHRPSWCPCPLPFFTTAFWGCVMGFIHHSTPQSQWFCHRGGVGSGVSLELSTDLFTSECGCGSPRTTLSPHG